VSIEYKSGVMDPSREVAIFEKFRSVKKAIGKSKRVIMGMPGRVLEQKKITTGINYLSII
jgi:hypothetical protein